MRLLVACPKCQRQYDASGRKPQSRFRCLCGVPVTVPQPKSHVARVVRCSSCGAPREEGREDCVFCGSDFTCHERDLHTVCPRCLARVSDRAKFCHYCGICIMPEAAAAGQTRLVCPACGEKHRLTSRTIGDVAVMECGRCVGLWLGHGTFERVTRLAMNEAIQLDQVYQSASRCGREEPAVEKQGAFYRMCPQCRCMMPRRNYGRGSGVIVDVCRDHGLWFDADELPRILQWIRGGGLARAAEERAAQTAREEIMKRMPKGTRAQEPAEWPSQTHDIGNLLAVMLSRLFTG